MAALVGTLELTASQAVATSLAIIFLNSISGLLGHSLFGHLELGIAAPLIADGVVGIAAGALVAGRAPEVGLRRRFALLPIVLAPLIAAESVRTAWGAWVAASA